MQMKTDDISSRIWRGRGELSVLGMGFTLPGEPISTKTLLAKITQGFDVDVSRRGQVFAEKLNIRQRYICRDFADRIEGPKKGFRNPDLAASAVKKALDEAGLDMSDIGYLIGHTATPATPVPSNISLVADKLDYIGPHMELRQACTGFANALVVAEGLLAAENAKPVVIVGSETGSTFFDPARLAEDTGQIVNLVQMGDAAAAVVLAPYKDIPRTGRRTGTLSRAFYGQIGNQREPGFSLRHGGSDCPSSPDGVLEFSHAFSDVRTNGPELFVAGLKAAAAQEIDVEAVDYVLPHQANGLMDVLMEQHMGIDRKRVVVNADKVGNTGSAAIWLALAMKRASMKSGERLLALGAEATKYMFGGFLYRHGS